MNRTKGLCVLGVTLLLAATPAFGNKVKKLTVSALSGYDGAPVVVVYSSSGEKWDRVDKTVATKATVRLRAECRYEGKGNKAYRGSLSLDGFTGVGDTYPDSILIPHAKTARRDFRYSGGASLKPTRVCGDELEKRLSQDASLTKYHLLAKGFSVKYPAAFRAQFYLTCKPTGLGFTDTSTKSANINAVIRCKASDLAKNKIPSSKPKPKRASPKPERTTLKRISAGFGGCPIVRRK